MLQEMRGEIVRSRLEAKFQGHHPSHVGFARQELAMLNDRAPEETDRYSRFVGNYTTHDVEYDRPNQIETAISGLIRLNSSPPTIETTGISNSRTSATTVCFFIIDIVA